MKRIAILIISIFIVIICFFQIYIKAASKDDYTIINVKIYKDTPAWELAQTVKSQNTWTIERIVKDNPALLNYQEPKYGATLLLWAVGTERFKSAETLLKCGADPNIASKPEGETPLFLAAGYSWVDNADKKDPKYVKILLQYGADPNKNYVGNDKNGTEPGTSPLMNSIPCGIEKTKALVEAGADINYKTKLGTTAAIIALFAKEFPEYAHYLIVENKAKVSELYHNRFSYSDPTKDFFPVDILTNWVFDLNSKEHILKMEIVKEFAHQGIDYRNSKIDNFTLEHIKKRYPNNWEEYIKKY